MNHAHDIPDSTDWLSTPLKDFSTLENALHCQICKEFYDTPMITSCAHTFCSKCIRTCLSTDGKCPSCRTSDQASKLRNNWALQEVVSTFLEARPTALEVAKKEQEAAQARDRKPAKRKRAVLDSEDVEEEASDARTTRSKSRRQAASQTSQADVVEVLDSDGDFEPEEAAPDDGLIECPLGCERRMKIEAIEPHLDKCEEERNRSQKTRAKARIPSQPLGLTNRTNQNGSRPERLPELSYSLYNDSKLSKKLKEIGIPSAGGKQLMVKRHVEWVNLWNANCDSNNPRSKRELLRELDAWERTQGGKSATGLANNVMRKDFDGAGWADKNKDDFSRLIADAKRIKSSPTAGSGQRHDDASETKAESKDPSKEEGEDDLKPEVLEHRSGSPHANHSDSAPYEAKAQMESPVRRPPDSHDTEPSISATSPYSSLEPGNVAPEMPPSSSAPEMRPAASNGHDLPDRHPPSSTQPSGSPVHVLPNPAKKMPMFATTEQP